MYPIGINHDLAKQILTWLTGGWPSQAIIAAMILVAMLSKARQYAKRHGP